MDVPIGTGTNQKFILLDLDIYRFLEKIFHFDSSHFYNVTRFHQISDIFNQSEIIEYNFIETLKSEYILKLKDNPTLHGILSYMELGDKDINEYKKIIMTRIYSLYKNIDEEKAKLLSENENFLNKQKEQSAKLKKFYKTESLEMLPDNIKRSINIFAPHIDELLIVREIQDQLYDVYKETIYLVGGSVRNILLKEPIKDLDITGALLPEDIVRVFKS